MRGVGGTVLMCGAALREKFAPSYRRVEARRQLAEATFDREHNVDTAGVVRPGPEEVVGSNWSFGVNYQAVDPGPFLQALQVVPLPYEQFVFVDLGSGKGRAILMAAKLPFARVVGVEYCERLNEVARTNVSTFPARLRRCGEIEVVCADACEYELPLQPLLLFLYNPFEAPVMSRVVQNVVRSLTEHPRRVVVIYFTPSHADLWEQTGRFSKMQADPAVFDTG